MRYRVVEPFEYRGVNGVLIRADRGELVDVAMRVDAEDLLRSGKIVPRVLQSTLRAPSASRSSRWSSAMRVGIWLRTSSHYSGGRIHMWQYAWCLADAGAEVYLITNAVPKWMHDYPVQSNIHVLIDEPPPDDIDLVVTDSKDSLGRQALEWRERHPWSKLVCMNFETPNWVAKFAKDKAKGLGGDRKVFERADVLMANSDESMSWLLKWMDAKPDVPRAVLHPCVNTYAIDDAEAAPAPREMERLGDRPFVLWCARGEKYKGADAAAKAVWSVGEPLDLVMFGSYTQTVPDNSDLHRVHRFNGLPDRAKFGFMRRARAVLAPSLFEGFGMVPGEALACGTPVVAFDLPVLRKEYAGLPGIHFAEHGNVRDFARTLRSVLSAPKEALDYAPVRERLGMRVMAETIEHIPHHAMRRSTVSAQLIAYWGFLPESVESVYNLVDEIVIAYGRVAHAPEIDDGTLARLQALPDPQGKIRLEVRDTWPDKRAMRNWCSIASRGNRMLVLDGDEVWTGLDEWIRIDPMFGTPRWVNLWHGGNHWVHDHRIGTSPRWGGPLAPYGSPCHHYRWSFWRRSYWWKKHHTPADQAGNPLTTTSLEYACQAPGCVIYHIGHALSDDVMRAKHEFYLARDGDDSGRRKRRDAWHAWDGKPGDCGDGIVDPVTWELPEIVQKALHGIERTGR